MQGRAGFGSEDSLASSTVEGAALIQVPGQMEMQTTQYHVCTPRCSH